MPSAIADCTLAEKTRFFAPQLLTVSLLIPTLENDAFLPEKVFWMKRGFSHGPRTSSSNIFTQIRQSGTINQCRRNLQTGCGIA